MLAYGLAGMAGVAGGLLPALARTGGRSIMKWKHIFPGNEHVGSGIAITISKLWGNYIISHKDNLYNDDKNSCIVFSGDGAILHNFRIQTVPVRISAGINTFLTCNGRQDGRSIASLFGKDFSLIQEIFPAYDGIDAKYITNAGRSFYIILYQKIYEKDTYIKAVSEDGSLLFEKSIHGNDMKSYFIGNETCIIIACETDDQYMIIIMNEDGNILKTYHIKKDDIFLILPCTAHELMNDFTLISLGTTKYAKHLIIRKINMLDNEYIEKSIYSISPLFICNIKKLDNNQFIIVSRDGLWIFSLKLEILEEFIMPSCEHYEFHDVVIDRDGNFITCGIKYENNIGNAFIGKVLRRSFTKKLQKF
jgi:hypothetical protein